ncbi:MAG: hypothetical protein CMA72_07695 [Euryarchaeota archaeon]|nr:hypothetical protein [Euryarchaeota archaeon]|tara:strand:- start:3632 stop:3877 length:246 start_codon:yes stop_codon:yes gene_type:complete
MPPKNAPSNTFDWMVVEQSLEEELRLERNIRFIEDCENIDVLSQLCVSLMRTQTHQSKLLKQCVGHVALLEAVFYDATQKP